MVKVLIVDDALEARMLVGRFLGVKGFDVIEAGNGAEGVEAALAHRPDVVLMDLNMPVMDGFRATREIRSHPELAGVTIVALTAEEDAVSREAIFEAGCDAFVRKPIDFEQLLSKLTPGED